MGKSKFLKPAIITSQDLSSGALSYTTSIDSDFQIEEIRFSFSVGITETITITLDSSSGANYDTVLRVRNLNGDTYFVYRPEYKVNYRKGDEIKIQCTNANLTGTVYAEIHTSETS